MLRVAVRNIRYQQFEILRSWPVIYLLISFMWRESEWEWNTISNKTDTLLYLHAQLLVN
jgi:hypothetical protein